MALGFFLQTGKCYPFDERVSGGFGPGEGASCVILKPMQDAIESGDCIRAIICGTGINQDGRTAGISLPSSEAQANLVKSVYQAAALDPVDTKFIEAHGTGTTAGDPLEAAAFASTIAQKATLEEPICIGSAKSNFGHLEGVSGIVSLIKAALMLEHKVLLPNANFKNANPRISSLGTQLRVGHWLPEAEGSYLSYVPAAASICRSFFWIGPKLTICRCLSVQRTGRARALEGSLSII